MKMLKLILTSLLFFSAPSRLVADVDPVSYSNEIAKGSCDVALGVFLLVASAFHVFRHIGADGFDASILSQGLYGTFVTAPTFLAALRLLFHGCGRIDETRRMLYLEEFKKQALKKNVSPDLLTSSKIA